MKFPWVSRAEYERVVNDAAQNAVRWSDLLAGSFNRYENLLACYHELATPPVAVVQEPVPASPREPDEITKVIREQAEGDVPLATHLRRYAMKLKREGFSPDEIVGKLVAWTTTEPDISS